MTTIVKASGGADLLAMIPELVGSTPVESVIFLAFRGKRTCGALRLDIPQNSTHYMNASNYAVGTLSRIPGADGLVIATFTDSPIGSELPFTSYVLQFEKRFRQAGFHVKDLLCQAGDGWGSYRDRRLPSGGHPLSDISESPVLALVPESDEEPPVVVGPGEADQFRSALAEARELMEGDYDEEEPLPAALEPLGDLPALAEEALEWDDAELLARGHLLLLAVQGPGIRDMTMLQWASDLPTGDLLFDQQERWNAGERIPTRADSAIDGLMLGRGPRPNFARVDRGIRLLSALVELVDAPDKPAPLCMLAWLNWALGRSSVASRHVAAARAIDPDYSMAELLDTMIYNGLLPDWAFSGGSF